MRVQYVFPQLEGRLLEGTGQGGVGLVHCDSASAWQSPGYAGDAQHMSDE